MESFLKLTPLNSSHFVVWEFELDTLKSPSWEFLSITYIEPIEQYIIYKFSKANFFTTNNSTQRDKETRYTLVCFGWTMKELTWSSNVPLVRNFFYSISFRAREMAQPSVTIALHEQMQDSFIAHSLWNQVVTSFVEIQIIVLTCIRTTHSSTAKSHAKKHSYQWKRKRQKDKNNSIHKVSRWVKKCSVNAWLKILSI